MRNLVLFGPPGAGKGTQAFKLKEHFNLVHISTGDLLRSEIKEETKLGIEAKSYMDAGKLVPDEVSAGVLVQVGDNDWSDDVAGIGLSGGGIRSATLNLGVLQAMAGRFLVHGVRRRIYRFFLGTLF